MKKLIALLFCLLVLVGCASAAGGESSNSSETTSFKKTEYYIYGWEWNYEKANYEKFNSPSSENGLGDTLISVEGIVTDAKAIHSKESQTFILSDEQGNEWAISSSDTNLKFPLSMEMKVYGVYLGQAKKVKNLPVLMLVRYQTYEGSENVLVNITAQEIPLYLGVENTEGISSLDAQESSNSTSPQLENSVGTRTSPVLFGQEYSGEYKRYGKDDFGFTINISEILRGQEAEDLAISKNKFNAGKIPEGKELLLYKVNFILNKYPAEDSFLCSSIYFKCFNSSYSEEKDFIAIAGLDDLHAELYEGGSTEGWLYVLVDKEDPKPLVRFDDNTWLALYK